MTQPTITAISNGTSTSASVVQANDQAIANAFGSLDTTDNIKEHQGLYTMGPVRFFIGTHVGTAGIIAKWKVPFALNLERMEVTPMQSTNDADGDGNLLLDYGQIDGTNSVVIYLQKSSTISGTYTALGNVSVASESPYIHSFAGGSQAVAAGDFLRISFLESASPFVFLSVTITATSAHVTKTTTAAAP